MADVGTQADSSLVHPFEIGGLRCLALSDGFVPTTTRMNAPEIDEDELATFLIDRGEHPTEKRTQISCLLVELPAIGPVLIDSGIGLLPGPGNKPIPTAGQLPLALEEAGIDPADIGHVLISHIHPDHVGGLFDENDRPRFPNAAYHVPEEEVSYWGQPEPDLDGSLLPPAMRVDVVTVAHRFLELAASRLVSFRIGDEPLPGVKAICMAGHTPGQAGFLFEGEGESLLYTADAFNHVFITLERPQWRFSFDCDSPRACAMREALTAQLLERGWYNFTPHFPWPSFGRVVCEQDRMLWRRGR